MILAHKIELYPNSNQLKLFEKCAGTARFTYNWALSEWSNQYKLDLKPNEAKLRVQFNSIKDTIPWISELPQVIIKNSIKNLGTAFDNFFRNPKKFKYPNFKRKGIKDSFRIDNGTDKLKPNAVNIIDNKIKLAKIGEVKLAELPRFEGNIKSAIISRTANKWFVALSFETYNILKSDFKHPVIGVDLGITKLATLSNGVDFKGKKPSRSLKNRLRRLNKSLSRKVKKSANWIKAKIKLSKLHAKIANIRKDYSHKLTTYLATTFNIIKIEDLAVSNLIKNSKLAFHIADASWYEIRRQLGYKTKMTGAKLVIIDRYYPSSKTCSNCGVIHNMPLGKSILDCGCGNIIDRDINAAINIAKWVKSEPKVNSGIACGVFSSGIIYNTKLNSEKQEQDCGKKDECLICP